MNASVGPALGRVSTPASLLMRQQASKEQQEIIAEKTRQATTGGVASVVDVKNPRAMIIAQIESGLSNVVENNSYVGGLVKEQEAAVENITKRVTEFVSSLTQVLTPEGGEADSIRAHAHRLLEEIQGILNQKNGDVYLFGGDDSSQKPVNRLINVPSNVGGEASTDYYQGGIHDFKMIMDPASPAITTSVTVRADVEALKEAIACVAEARDSAFDQAHVRGVAAVKKLAHLQQDLRAQGAQIEATNQQIEQRIGNNKAMLARETALDMDEMTSLVEQQQEVMMAQMLGMNMWQGTQQVMKQMLGNGF